MSKHTNTFAYIILTAVTIFLSGCSAAVKDYSSNQPSLDLQEYLQGPLKAWGIFQNRSGLVVRQFEVQIEASWEGNIGTLVEDFQFADGEQQQRIWTITKLNDNHYVGKAGDVIGEAKGESYGNAMQWRYTMALDVDGKTYHVKFDDWMFLIDDRTLVNRAKMKKLGFTLGEVTLFFQRQTPLNNTITGASL